MKDRQLAWSSPEILKLAEPFLPAADEVGKLERGRGAASKFYRKIARRHTERLRTTQDHGPKADYSSAPGRPLFQGPYA